MKYLALSSANGDIFFALGGSFCSTSCGPLNEISQILLAQSSHSSHLSAFVGQQQLTQAQKQKEGHLSFDIK